MISVLSRAIAALRVWVGLNEPAENRLHPSRGWLLPAPDPRTVATLRVPSPVPVTVPGRRR